ncbi:MAG: cobalamin B12-binding domain-containing protein [Bacillota bacterium]
MKRRILLVPLDPVHDVGLKMIRRGLDEAGHETVLLPPDTPPEEIVEAALRAPVDCILVSRTLGYDVAETVARFVDLAEAAGLREKVRLGIGGMAIRPELAAELGFDGAFGPGTTVEQAVAFVEGRPAPESGGDVVARAERPKPRLGEGHTYAYAHRGIEQLLDEIADQFLHWAEGKTSPGVERAYLRREIIAAEKSGRETVSLRRAYGRLSTGVSASYYATGELPDTVRRVTAEELSRLEQYRLQADRSNPADSIRRGRPGPLLFTQYGTGCLVTDVAHIKVLEGWSTDGVVHFDPSWGARTEGLLEGALSHRGDGTPISLENLARIKGSLAPHTLLQVRAHRGLNTAETVLLAAEVGADLTKINIAYGALAGGTDPERMAVDGLEAMRLAAMHQMAYDVVTNEELAGVPAHKAFASMLVTAHIGRRLGGRPVLQPLFCHGPEAMVRGLMDDNYVNFNAAKVLALRQIVDAPIWPGAPVGFMTHTADRVQSAMTTALHAALASALGLDAVTIASTDEAYSGGPITAAARVDTLRAVQETLRFFGEAAITPTAQAGEMAGELVESIEAVLVEAVKVGFVPAMMQGIFGSPDDGAHPGRAGRGTVRTTVRS